MTGVVSCAPPAARLVGAQLEAERSLRQPESDELIMLDSLDYVYNVVKRL